MRNIDTSSVDEVHENAEMTELDIIEDDDWMVRWTSARKQLGKIWTGGTENNLTVERLSVTTLYSFLQKIFVQFSNCIIATQDFTIRNYSVIFRCDSISIICSVTK